MIESSSWADEQMNFSFELPDGSSVAGPSTLPSSAASSSSQPPPPTPRVPGLGRVLAEARLTDPETVKTAQEWAAGTFGARNVLDLIGQANWLATELGTVVWPANKAHLDRQLAEENRAQLNVYVATEQARTASGQIGSAVAMGRLVEE